MPQCQKVASDSSSSVSKHCVHNGVLCPPAFPTKVSTEVGHQGSVWEQMSVIVIHGSPGRLIPGVLELEAGVGGAEIILFFSSGIVR